MINIWQSALSWWRYRAGKKMYIALVAHGDWISSYDLADFGACYMRDVPRRMARYLQDGRVEYDATWSPKWRVKAQRPLVVPAVPAPLRCSYCRTVKRGAICYSCGGSE